MENFHPLPLIPTNLTQAMRLLKTIPLKPTTWPEVFDTYSLKELSMMSFEQWARLIEIENSHNNA